MPNIQPGTYRGRPVAAALGLAGTGTEQIAVTFEFVDPPGERLTWYGFFTENTEERTVEALRHCGWHGDDLSVFVQGQPLPEGFDQEVELVVKQEQYQGKTQTRIAFVNSGGGMALKNALDADQAQAFAKRMKSKISAFDKAAGRTASAPKNGAARPPAKPAPARQTQAPPASEGVPQEVLDAQEGEHAEGERPF
jgi:hypothetical protein